jgi:hypothetical protein
VLCDGGAPAGAAQQIAWAQLQRGRGPGRLGTRGEASFMPAEMSGQRACFYKRTEERAHTGVRGQRAFVRFCSHQAVLPFRRVPGFRVEPEFSECGLRFGCVEVAVAGQTRERCADDRFGRDLKEVAQVLAIV